MHTRASPNTTATTSIEALHYSPYTTATTITEVLLLILLLLLAWTLPAQTMETCLPQCITTTSATTSTEVLLLIPRKLAYPYASRLQVCISKYYCYYEHWRASPHNTATTTITAMATVITTSPSHDTTVITRITSPDTTVITRSPSPDTTVTPLLYLGSPRTIHRHLLAPIVRSTSPARGRWRWQSCVPHLGLDYGLD